MAINRIQKHLDDILNSINNTEASATGLKVKHYDNYEISWIVERGIEITAEALKRILIIDSEIAITNVHKIIATRNKITHEYDVVDHYRLYIIATKYLPILKQEVDSTLSNQNP